MKNVFTLEQARAGLAQKVIVSTNAGMPMTLAPLLVLSETFVDVEGYV